MFYSLVERFFPWRKHPDKHEELFSNEIPPAAAAACDNTQPIVHLSSLARTQLRKLSPAKSPSLSHLILSQEEVPLSVSQWDIPCDSAYHLCDIHVDRRTDMRIPHGSLSLRLVSQSVTRARHEVSYGKRAALLSREKPWRMPCICDGLVRSFSLQPPLLAATY